GFLNLYSVTVPLTLISCRVSNAAALWCASAEAANAIDIEQARTTWAILFISSPENCCCEFSHASSLECKPAQTKQACHHKDTETQKAGSLISVVIFVEAARPCVSVSSW